MNSDTITDDNLSDVKPYQNIILENLNKNVDERLIYSLFNIVDIDNKFIIVTSEIPIVNINFSLVDLKSRTKKFYNTKNRKT